MKGKPQAADKTNRRFQSPAPVNHQNIEQKMPKMEENITQSGMPQIHQESELKSDLDNGKRNMLISELDSANVAPKIEQTNLMNNFNGQFQSNVQSQNGQEIKGFYGNPPIYGHGSYEQTHHQNYPKVLPEIIKPYPANTLYPSQFEQNLQTSAYSEFQANKPEIEKWPSKTISEYVEPLPPNTLYR